MHLAVGKPVYLPQTVPGRLAAGEPVKEPGDILGEAGQAGSRAEAGAGPRRTDEPSSRNRDR
jgi:hypothetical protein